MIKNSIIQYFTTIISEKLDEFFLILFANKFFLNQY